MAGRILVKRQRAWMLGRASSMLGKEPSANGRQTSVAAQLQPIHQTVLSMLCHLGTAFCRALQACEWGRLRLELCDRATITSCNCTRSSYLAQPSAVPGTAGARCCQVPCPTRSGQHLGARPPAAHECRQRNRNGFLDAMLREGRIKQHPRAHPPAVDE
eukprot:1158689-Pelagomonas_calceolata.AAC.16